VTIKGCNIQNFANGVYLYNTTNSFVTNNSISNIQANSGSSSTADYGVFLNASSGNSIINNTIFNGISVSGSGSAYAGGIYALNSNNALLYNNTLTNHSATSSGENPAYGFGIKNENSNNTNISKNTISLNLYGIYPLSLSDNVTMDSNTLSSNSYDIYSGAITNSAMTNNIINGALVTEYGFYLSAVSSPISFLNNAISNTSISLTASNSPITIANFTIGCGNGGTGIYVYGSSTTTFNNISIQNCTYAIAPNGNNHIFKNIFINNSSYGIYISGFNGGINNSFYNSTIASNVTTDVFIDNAWTGTYLLNTTWNRKYGFGTECYTESPCDFNVSWYAQVNTTNSTGSGLPANVSVNNSQGAVEYTGIAGADGLTSWFVIKDLYSYKDDTGVHNTSFNNHTINASLTNYYTNYSSINATSSNTYPIILISSLLNCGTLSTANTIYNMTGNINSNTHCYTISANNITLDCKGYLINGNYTLAQTGTIIGIRILSVNNTLIKNCFISNFTEGIYSVSSYNNNITDSGHFLFLPLNNR
jgi:parallel beta-helix repeat protein